MDDGHSIAHHEAGHAVALRQFGRTIESIKIYRICGEARWDGTTTVDANVRQPTLSNCDQALICMAGFAAENEYRRNTDSVEMHMDIFLDDERYSGDRGDAWKALQPCLSLDVRDDDDDALNELIERELQRARQLVADPRHWRAVVAIARKLADQNHIPGEDAMEIIDAELGHTEGLRPA